MMIILHLIKNSVRYCVDFTKEECRPVDIFTAKTTAILSATPLPKCEIMAYNNVLVTWKCSIFISLPVCVCVFYWDTFFALRHFPFMTCLSYDNAPIDKTLLISAPIILQLFSGGRDWNKEKQSKVLLCMGVMCGIAFICS